MVDEQPASDRNILDMIRDDQSSGSKKNWKSFRDKLRLKRTGKAWISSVPIPASDIPIQGKSNRMMTKRGSWRYPTDADADAVAGESESEANMHLGHMPERQRSARLLPVETDPEDGDGNNPEQKPAAGEGDQQISLMALLSTDGSNYVEGEEEHVEEHREEKVEEGDAGDGQICGGCAAKCKGTAVGPCGHTFCKQCTKELQVSKGTIHYSAHHSIFLFMLSTLSLYATSIDLKIYTHEYTQCLSIKIIPLTPFLDRSMPGEGFISSIHMVHTFSIIKYPVSDIVVYVDWNCTGCFHVFRLFSAGL
ncbi:hypothetical protein SSX86_022270 [Deinandra increscens subsp. villosa]|uniref:RING-type domain-containing protein n=1 Tax=Deinandra increscens subsp. villosa TaxID=3103831 RepID=A0AAP0GSA2_9ASTR